MPQIEHIVIYMQENHSYDNYFGMLGRGDGFTLGRDGRPTNSNPDLARQPGPRVPRHRRPATRIGGDHSLERRAPRVERRRDGRLRPGGNGAPNVMGYYDETDLPFYYGLARTFPICDRWFCSVLGQTYPEPPLPAGGHLGRHRVDRHRRGARHSRSRPTA